MTLLVGIMLAALALMNALHAKSYLYPPSIFSAVWAFLLLGLALSGPVFYPLSFLANAIFFLGALAFSFGGMTALILTANRAPDISTSPPLHGGRFVDSVLNLGLAAQLVIAPLYLRQLKAMSSLTGAESLLVGIRLQTVLGEGAQTRFGGFAYLVAIVTFLTLIAFYESDDTPAKRIRAYLYIFITLAYQLLSASRTGAVLTIVSLAIIAVIKTGRIRLKTALVGIAVFLIIFSIPAILLSKGGSLEQSPIENFFSIAESLRYYALPSLVAFDQTLAAGEPAVDNISFRSFIAIANALGAGIDLPPAMLEYTLTPLSTNVYTMYYFYCADFGLVGMVFFMFVLGMFCTFVYLYAMSGEPRSVILFSMIATSLILSGINEPFLSAASFWIQAVVIVSVIYSRTLNRMFGAYER